MSLPIHPLIGRIRGMSALRALLALFFTIALIIPIAALGTQVLQGGTLAALASATLVDALGNSLLAAALGAAATVALALGAALALTRSNLPRRGAWVIALTLPMLIPSIAHGMGLVYLLGSNGIVTNLLNGGWSIYGLPGIVLGSVIYTFPPTFLLLYDALRYENCVVYDAADIMGIPPLSQFARITLPYLKKPLISATFAAFTLNITDYGVPIIAGGKFTTLSVLMYQEVVGLLEFNVGVAIGSLLIVPALISFIADLLISEHGSLSFTARPKRIARSLRRDIGCGAYCAVLAALLAMPIIVFGVVAFATKYPLDLSPTLANIDRALAFGMPSYLANALAIATATSMVGTTLSWAAAYLSTRTPGASARVLHLLCITTLAIPGIVLGLAYMLFFRTTPLYGTLGILVMANLVHFFASPYLMARNALSKLNGNLEAVGQTLGIPQAHLVLDVILPQTRDTVLEMASYFFVNCMVTISAVSFIASVSHMPIALLISDFDTQMLIECAALVSLVIFGVNVALKSAVFAIRRLAGR